MTILKARNVNGLLMPALRLIQAEGQPVSSRAGPVLTVPWPVMSVYERPRERVLLHPLRHCNPFFHFFEAMWMLAGRNDVEYLEQFVPRMATFAEDNGLLHGAYGYRWRKHYGGMGTDQLKELRRLQKENERLSRAVSDLTLDKLILTEASRGNY